jgi:hypothetical protein
MGPTLKVIPAVPQACRIRSVPVIVSTVNVNGIRAAIKERSSENVGLLPWLEATTADVVCLQETRADDEQLAGALGPALCDGWHLASAAGDIKGRNGVAVLSRHPIQSVRGLGDVGAPPALLGGEFALHGRYLEVDIDGLTVASAYVQTGEAGTDRQLEKERLIGAETSRSPDFCLPNGSGSPTCSPRAGSTWCGCCTRMSRARTRGGHGGEGLSTTMQAGASTTNLPPTVSPLGQAPRGWSGRRPTRCAGPTTRR